MKIDLTTGTWQDNPGCPINITLVSTSDAIVFIRREAYNHSIVNFGAAFAATQEMMKSQADNLVAIQNQLSNIQLCMNVGQQPPSSGYAPAQ